MKKLSKKEKEAKIKKYFFDRAEKYFQDYKKQRDAKRPEA